MSLFIRPLLGKLFKLRERRDDEEVKPFLDHLEDLRWMLVKMAATLAVTMMLSFGFRHQLMHVVVSPLKAVTTASVEKIQNAGPAKAMTDGEVLDQLQSLHPADSMSISLSLAFYAGFIISFPLLLYFLAGFVLPALTAKERSFVLPAIGVSFALFLSGVSFCFFYVLPLSLRWLFYDSISMGFKPQWTVGEYFSFATQFVLIFGLSFELPVVVIALVQFGLLKAGTLRSTRAYAMVIILVFATILAPSADPITMGIVAAPMLILYEACIWIAYWMERHGQGRGTQPAGVP